MDHLSKYERETIINYNEAEATAGVYTHNKALRRKLEQWALDRPEDCRLEKVSRFGEAVDYIVPKSWVHIYPPRQISEEQRGAMAARMKSANIRQKAPTAQGDFYPAPTQPGKDTTQPTDGGKEA